MSEIITRIANGNKVSRKYFLNALMRTSTMGDDALHLEMRHPNQNVAANMKGISSNPATPASVLCCRVGKMLLKITDPAKAM
ncbi:MAG: hypothetical protein KGR99_13900 [Betaproteobacteria bacterium]|nr:hypothetical protein [Betaproteobacteria bacterium]